MLDRGHHVERRGLTTCGFPAGGSSSTAGATPYAYGPASAGDGSKRPQLDLSVTETLYRAGVAVNAARAGSAQIAQGYR